MCVTGILHQELAWSAPAKDPAAAIEQGNKMLLHRSFSRIGSLPQLSIYIRCTPLLMSPLFEKLPGMCGKSTTLKQG
jgi:hypothetical protein